MYEKGSSFTVSSRKQKEEEEKKKQQQAGKTIKGGGSSTRSGSSGTKHGGGGGKLPPTSSGGGSSTQSGSSGTKHGGGGGKLTQPKSQTSGSMKPSPFLQPKSDIDLAKRITTPYQIPQTTTQQAQKNNSTFSKVLRSFVGQAAKSVTDNARSQRSKPAQMQAYNQQKKNRERVKEIEYQQAQIRKIRDDKKAEEKTAKLPKKVLELLDDYNKTRDTMQVNAYMGMAFQAPGSQIASRNSAETNHLRSIEQKLTGMGYDNYEELASYRKRITDKERAQVIEQGAKEFAQEHPAGAFAIGRAMSIPSAISGSIDALMQYARGGSDLTLNTNTLGFRVGKMQNAMDQGVLENMEDGKVLDEKWKRRLYQTAAGTVDSVTAAMLPGGEVLLGLGAANDAVIDATDRGVGRNKALLTGLASGAAESIGEHFSLELLRGFQEGMVRTGWDVLKNMGKSFVTNVGEEANTEIMGKAAEWWINGGASVHNQRKMDLVYSGVPEDEAEKMAWQEDFRDVYEAGLGGGLQSLLMGGGGNVLGSTRYRSAMNQRGAQIAEEDGGVQRVAQEADAARQQEGGLTGAQKRRLERMASEAGQLNAQQQAAASQITQQDVAKMLQQEDGRTEKSANSTAELIVKAAQGEKLTEKQQKRLNTDEAAQRTLQRVVETAEREGRTISDYNGLSAKQQRTLAQAEEMTAMQTQARQTNALEAAAQQRLMELGEDEKAAKKHAPALAATAMGEDVGTADRISLRRSEAAQQVAREMLGGAAWVREALTQRTETETRAETQEQPQTVQQQTPKAQAAEAAETRQESTAAPQKARAAAETQAAPRMTRDARELEQLHFERTEGVSREQFDRDFTAFYQRGRAGNITLEQALDADTLTNISAEAKTAAFRAGERAAKTQNAVVIRGIASVDQSGDVQLIDKDGNRRSMSETTLDPVTQRVVREAAGYQDTATANAFFAGFTPGSSFSAYRRAFATFYAGGASSGQTFAQFSKRSEMQSMLRYLDTQTARAAFAGGEKLRQGEQQRQKKTPARKGKGEYRSFVEMDEIRDVLMEATAKKTGFDIELLQSVNVGGLEANGRFIVAVCKMQLNRNADSVFATMLHELTHGTAAFNSKGFQGAAKALLQWYMNEKGYASFEARIDEIMAAYRQADADFTREDAIEEFVAEAVAGLFSTDAGAEHFVSWLQESAYTQKQKQTVFQKITDLFKEIVDGIKAIIRDGTLSKTAQEFAEMQADQAQEIRQMFLDALDGMRVQEQEGTRAKASLSKKAGPDYNVENGLVEIARISTFGTQNNRDIIRRLMGTSPFFKGLIFADAAEQFFYAERNGLVRREDDYLVVYHDAGEQEFVGKASLKQSNDTADKLRHSLGLDEVQAQNRNLVRQNKVYVDVIRALQQQVQELQQELKNRNTRYVVDEKKVRQQAAQLKKEYASRIKTDELTRQLTELYQTIGDGQGMSRDVVRTHLEAVADSIISQSANMQPQISEYSQTVLDDIRSVDIQLNDTQKAEAAYRFGSYGAFYRQSFGALRIRNDGVPLDTRWKELSETYPAIFSADASEAEQAVLLLEAVQALKNDYLDDNGFDADEAKAVLTAELEQGLLDATKPDPVLARYQQKMQKENDALRQRIADMKTQFREEHQKAVQQARAEIREARKDAASKVRAEFDEKFVANKAKYDRRVEAMLETREKQGGRKYIERRISRFQRMMAPTRGNDNVVQSLRPLVQKMLDVFPQSRMDGFKEKPWTSLKEAYEKTFKENEDLAELYGDVRESIIDDIKTLREQTKGKRLSQLTTAQLDMIKRVMDHLNTMIKNEQEVIIDGRKQKTAIAGAKAMQEAEQNAKRRRFNLGEKLRKFDINNKKPIYFFRAVGKGSVMEQLFNDTRKGQNVWARQVLDAKTFFDATFEKYNARNWMKDEKTFTLHDWDGKAREDVTLTVGQMLSLYATARREGINAQANRGKQTMHLLGGGFCFEDQWVKKGKGNNAYYEMDGDAHQLTADDVLAVADALTKEQKSYADEMVEYLSTHMAELGNEVTRQLYGFDMFNESYYFPLNVKKSFLFQKFGEQGESMLQAMGFTNATKHNANTPIILSAFDEVWAGHVERMSAYHALVIPINSMQRVWNYKESVGEFGKQKTMAQTFTKSYGKEYADYFQQFMRDINGDMVGDKREEDLNAMIRKFKKNAVFASASVTVQQPSAVMRAMAYIDPKYFTATAAVNREKMYAEAKQYSGLAIIKEMGGFDVGSGKTAVDWMLESETKPTTLREKAAALVNVKDSSFRDDLFGKPAGKADEITWAHIWAACKKQVQVEEGLRGEALNRRTAEVFNDVIDLTQVYDSVFSRSANMRSKGGLMQAATAFMGEPTTTINMLQDAFQQKDKKFAAKITAACVAQVLFNAALKSIITAGRDDDDDKNPFEKYVAQIAGNFFDDLNPLSMLPYFRDVVSLLKGFDVGRSELAVVEDLIGTIQKVLTGDDPWNWENAKALLGALGPFVDLPARNVLRDIDAAVNTWHGFRNGTKPTKAGAWYAIQQELFPIAKNFDLYSVDAKAARLYDAYQDGDAEMYGRIAKQYKSSDAVKNALVGQIKDAYLSGELDIDGAEEQLQQIGIDKATARFQYTKAWSSEKVNKMFEEPEAEKTGGFYTLDGVKEMQQVEPEDEGGVKYVYLQRAFESGDRKQIKAEIDELRTFGVDEKTLNSKIKSYVKEYDQDVIKAAKLYKKGDVGVVETTAKQVAKRYGVDESVISGAIHSLAGVKSNAIPGTVYVYGDIHNAIESGDIENAKKITTEIVNAKMAEMERTDDSKDEYARKRTAYDGVRQSLSTYWKPKWIAADSKGRAEIERRLWATGIYYNYKQFKDTIERWRKSAG